LPVAANVLGLSSKLYRQITTDSEDRLRGDAVTLQLGITYQAMSLSERSGDVSLKIASGDRAPDAPGLDGSGRAIRLFDVFRGPQITLLRLFGSHGAMVELTGLKNVDVVASPPQVTVGEVFVDAFGHAAAAYGGGHGEYLLIRPDGYVGWMGLETDLPDLHRYLERVR
jgi:hypothetical protein